MNLYQERVLTIYNRIQIRFAMYGYIYMSYRIVSYRIISYRIISYHIISPLNTHDIPITHINPY